MCENGNFFNLLKHEKIYFNEDTIINFLLSLKVKPFVIFTGNSGTGKTKLAKLFAECLSKRSENYGSFKLIPVGANWTENRHMVGFHNVLSKKYQSTPILKLLQTCETDEQNRPYFLILDEMNLSHVERYFSDFLSAIESHEKIPLHNCNNGIADENGDPIEKDISIPMEFFIIGTVNIDETTYMFSPKVLDRANIIEFETFSNNDSEGNNLSIEEYMYDTFNYNEISDPAEEYLENPLSDLDLRTINIHDLKEKFNNEDKWKKLCDELTKFHVILKKSNFDFGFRTINEVLSFMYVAKEFEKRNGDPAFENWEKYFDAQIKQKMLPKLHGSEILLDTLNELYENCLEENDDNTKRVRYKASANKIDEMRELLKKQKYVSFIN